MGDIACSPGEFLLLSPHKIYLFFLILFSTSTCEGRLSKQLHGALLPAAVKSLQAPDSFCEAAWLKLCCCCLSRVGGPEQPLSAWCSLENGGKAGKEDAAWQWKAKDDAPEMIKICLSQLYLRDG